MTWPQGIAFRNTLAYVTDGANVSAEVDPTAGAATYPRVTAQGNTVGWETSTTTINFRDRSTSVDARLAGMNWVSAGTGNVNTYRVDITPGSWTVRIACGDPNYAGDTFAEIFDGTTSLGVLTSGATSAASRWKDATNVERTSSADWVSNNASVTLSFATSILRVKIGSAGAGGTIAYLEIDSAVSASNNQLAWIRA